MPSRSQWLWLLLLLSQPWRTAWKCHCDVHQRNNCEKNDHSRVDEATLPNPSQERHQPELHIEHSIKPATAIRLRSSLAGFGVGLFSSSIETLRRDADRPRFGVDTRKSEFDRFAAGAGGFRFDLKPYRLDADPPANIKLRRFRSCWQLALH